MPARTQVVLGFIVGCIIMSWCTYYWYKKKQARILMMVDKNGKIIKEFDEEALNVEGQILQDVLNHYIQQQTQTVNDKYADEIRRAEQLVLAYEVIEGEELGWDDDDDDDADDAETTAELTKFDNETEKMKAELKGTKVTWHSDPALLCPPPLCALVLGAH
jgi:hypothetical protein